MSEPRQRLTIGMLARILPLAAWHGLKIGLAAAIVLMPLLLAVRAAGFSLQDAGVLFPLAAIMVLIMLPVSFFEAHRSDLKGRMQRAIDPAN